VPQATEEAVLAVTSLYPTLLSLAQAYAMLVSPLSLFNLCKCSFHLQHYTQVRRNVSNACPYVCLSQNTLTSLWTKVSSCGV
jgi:hypothetical protein